MRHSGGGMKIILASASPRRRELLGQIGLDVEIRVSDVEEKVSAVLPEQVVEELSAQKAGAVLETLSDSTEDMVVIGADTVVALEGQILGKPRSPNAGAAFREDTCGLYRRDAAVPSGHRSWHQGGSLGRNRRYPDSLDRRIRA